MNKLLVATRSGGEASKMSRILTCLQNYPEGATPKIIAFTARINVNTVKSILPKMTNIKKVLRGLYKVVEGGDGAVSPKTDELHNWCFHNCILSSQLKDYPGKTITSTNSFGIVNYEFTISIKGNATLRVTSDNPINVSSICVVYAYMRELINKHSKDVIAPKDVRVSTIEFNRDYTNLRLDGIRCITMDSLIEQFKVYQKKAGMRLEHKTKIPFSVENVIDMLSNNPNSLELNIKLSQQKEQLDKLTAATTHTSAMLTNLIDKMNKEALE